MRQGYIREPEDIKFLIIYGLGLLPMAVSEADLLEVVMVDDGFGYLEFAQCFHELIEARHISQLEVGGEKQYLLSLSGRRILELMPDDHLRLTVRDKAQAEALKLIKRIRRDNNIRTSHKDNGDGTFTVTLAVRDKSTDITTVSMLVYSERQCTLLENNFRQNAETIYKGMLALLLNDGSQKKDPGEG